MWGIFYPAVAYYDPSITSLFSQKSALSEVSDEESQVFMVMGEDVRKSGVG